VVIFSYILDEANDESRKQPGNHDVNKAVQDNGNGKFVKYYI